VFIALTVGLAVALTGPFIALLFALAGPFVALAVGICGPAGRRRCALIDGLTVGLATALGFAVTTIAPVTLVRPVDGGFVVDGRWLQRLFVELIPGSCHTAQRG
jgi:hypothetical protein